MRDKFIQSWLACYPQPICCVHDKGSKFIGCMFQWLLHSFDIKDVQSTSKNPQSNLICECMHQTVGNVLRVLLYSNPLQNLTQARDIVDQTLATAMHSMQVTTASTLGSTPGALAFSRNMLLNVPLIVDLHTIAQHCEQYVNDNLCHTNRKQHQYDYALGQKVLNGTKNYWSLQHRASPCQWHAHH